MALSGGGHLINLFTLEDADLDGLPERASIGSIEVTSATGINYPSDLGCALVLVGSYSNATQAGELYHDFQNCFNQNYIYYKLVYNLWKSNDSVNTGNSDVCIAIDDGTSPPAYNNNRNNSSCEGVMQQLHDSDSVGKFYTRIGNGDYPRITNQYSDHYTASWCGVMGEMSFWHPYRTDSFKPCQMYGFNITRDNINDSETFRFIHSAHWEPLNSSLPSTGIRMWAGATDMTSNLEATNLTAMMYAYKTS